MATTLLAVATTNGELYTTVARPANLVLDRQDSRPATTIAVVVDGAGVMTALDVYLQAKLFIRIPYDKVDYLIYRET